jgi:hypothetical protein
LRAASPAIVAAEIMPPGGRRYQQNRELAKRTLFYVYVAAKRFAVPLYRYHNDRGRPIVWRLK